LIGTCRGGSPGDTVRLTVVNRSLETQPWHLHGHPVLVLSRDGTPSSGSPLWIDTLDVRPGETWEVALHATNPGIWMTHCHNLPHAEQGMMLRLHYDGVTTHSAAHTREADTMATDPAGPAQQPAAYSDDPRSNLIPLVHRRSRAIIDAELHRLARRVPSLSRDELNVIDAALEHLTESLLLARLRRVAAPHRTTVAASLRHTQRVDTYGLVPAPPVIRPPNRPGKQ
jgi:hypothetical protein